LRRQEQSRGQADRRQRQPRLEDEIPSAKTDRRQRQPRLETEFLQLRQTDASDSPAWRTKFPQLRQGAPNKVHYRMEVRWAVARRGEVRNTVFTMCVATSRQGAAWL
jgi:hypothetical protein